MPKISLAEDDNDMRRFSVKASENAGFQVSSHDNGMAAYQRLREEPFEMSSTDIVMPEMDGIELARRASELDPDIKIMFITGFAAVQIRTRSKRDSAASRKEYGEDTPSGRRRTTIAEAAPTREFSMDAMIEKEPVTVILSQRGWIRAAKGHLPLDGDFKFKEGDGPAFA
ncbi:hypothetical protein OY671_008715, partial [Metschnikowia pulcherrima]